MFRKSVVSLVLLVLLAVLVPGTAGAVQYPLEPTTDPPVEKVVKGPGTEDPESPKAEDPESPKAEDAKSPKAKFKAASAGKLPKTGTDNVALLLRTGVVLLVAGFVFNQSGRVRSTGRSDDARLGTTT